VLLQPLQMRRQQFLAQRQAPGFVGELDDEEHQ
jgi:hypothetical protein